MMLEGYTFLRKTREGSSCVRFHGIIAATFLLSDIGNVK